MALPYITAPDSLDAIRAELDALIGGLPAEPVSAAEARRLHARRQLRGAADFGLLMLDAIGLGPLALDAVDGLISTLDTLDGDADAELGADDEDDGTAEPSLASPELHPSAPSWPASWPTSWSFTSSEPGGSQLCWAAGATDDREAVNEDGDPLDQGEHDAADAEPSLGWPEDYRARLAPVLGADTDCEHDDVDLEDTDEDQDHRDPWHGPAVYSSAGGRAHV